VGEKIKTETADARPWRFRGWHLFLLCCAILYFGPITQTYPEQDSCSFGSVTNEEYRAMLREARKDARVVLKKMNRFATTWKPKSYDHETFNSYFRTHVQETDDVERMVAGMHARMRALGAWHIWSDYKYRSQPYAGRDFGAHFLYGIVAQDVRELRLWDAVFRFADITYSIRRNAGESRYYLTPPNAAGASFFSLKNFPHAGRDFPRQPCPSVPQEKPTGGIGRLVPSVISIVMERRRPTTILTPG